MREGFQVVRLGGRVLAPGADGRQVVLVPVQALAARHQLLAAEEQVEAVRPAVVAGLPTPGGPTSFGLIEHHVGDLADATRLFTEALGGQLNDAGDDTAELTWPGGKRIRLVREDGLPLGGLLHHVRFTRADGAFTTQDQERAGLLAKRLGLTVELAD